MSIEIKFITAYIVTIFTGEFWCVFLRFFISHSLVLYNNKNFPKHVFLKKYFLLKSYANKLFDKKSKIRPLWSKHVFLVILVKTFLGNRKKDIYECPKSGFTEMVLGKTKICDFRFLEKASKNNKIRCSFIYCDLFGYLFYEYKSPKGLKAHIKGYFCKKMNSLPKHCQVVKKWILCVFTTTSR
jgi:hypothetical protein